MRTLICQVDFILHMSDLRGGRPILSTWKQTIILYTSAKKHDLQMFSLRSCHVIRVRAPIHQHRTSRIPCSICQVSPCRRYSSTSRCKARLSRTVSGGYLAGIIWTVILATWMTWQAIHPFYIQPYTHRYVYIHSDIHVSCIHNDPNVAGECNMEAPTLAIKENDWHGVPPKNALCSTFYPHNLYNFWYAAFVHLLFKKTCAPHLAASKPEASVRKRSAWTVQLCRIARPSFELPM